METKTLATVAGAAIGLFIGLFLACPVGVLSGAFAAWLAEKGLPLPESPWVMFTAMLAFPVVCAAIGGVLVRQLAGPRRPLESASDNNIAEP